MPPRSRTLGDLLDEMATARHDADAVVFLHWRWTCTALKARAEELARALLEGAQEPRRVR